jgi:Integrase core domain
MHAAARCGAGAIYFPTNDDNTITITGYTGSDGAVVIPDTTNGYPVTSIGDGAFAYSAGLIIARRVAFASRPRIVTTISPSRPTCWPKVPKATAPNQLWVADITYVETQEGWLYLAAILDLYSRKIVGWGMSERIAPPSF